MELIFKGRVVRRGAAAKAAGVVHLFVSVTHVGDAADAVDLERFVLKTPVVVLLTMRESELDDVLAAVPDADRAKLKPGYTISGNDRVGSDLVFIAEGIHAWDGKFVLNNTDLPVHRLAGFMPESVSLVVPAAWDVWEERQPTGLLQLEYAAPVSLVAAAATEAVQAVLEDTADAAETFEDSVESCQLVDELLEHLGVGVS